MYGSKGVNTGAKIAEVRVSVRAVYLATLGVGIPTVFLLMGLAYVLGGGKHCGASPCRVRCAGRA